MVIRTDNLKGLAITGGKKSGNNTLDIKAIDYTQVGLKFIKGKEHVEMIELVDGKLAVSFDKDVEVARLKNPKLAAFLKLSFKQVK